MFNKFIDDLDPEKNIFMQSDIDLLKKNYETRIDDEIKGAPAEFFLEAGKSIQYPPGRSGLKRPMRS
ncbi:MAG: hypothetical protein WDO16_15775 [Bacteroidota bacterium]